ncbi:FAD-dependent oxidoreductase [Cellulomonas sp.]|uniref:oxidoreductase n=1 Tax=Cellulomonas sp. TaxID=40001 RepID=UPI003BAAEF46
MSAFAHVIAPGRIGALELANRVIMPPMGTSLSDADGHFSDRQVAWYAERAGTGAGLVVTELTAVSRDLELTAGLAHADSDAAIPALTRLADAVHAKGGRLGVQLTAGMGRNNPAYTAEQPPVSASDNPNFFDPTVLCRPLTTDEVRALVGRFAEAAVRCAAAGVDMVDLHGHTGYLIDQFLGPQWNRRTDVYGGSVTNRARFATEIIQAIKAAVPDLPISFRLSVSNKMPGSRDVAEAQQVARLLEAAGLDLLMVDDGAYDAMDWVFPPYYLGDACMVPSARDMKAVVSIPVMAVGNLTPENAEGVLAAGDADFVGIGRGLIADPEWVTKLADGRRDDIRPCIRCNQLCIGAIFTGATIGCAVNPTAGYELERALVPAAVPKRIAVVGGGPAGLEAARVAALRGHAVDVYEKAERLGGVLLPAATPEFKKELRAMIGWWERQIADLPVTVHLGTEILADDTRLAGADEVVVATGADPFVLPIPGVDGENVLEVLDAHLHRDRVGSRVVVAGGGLSGADLALELAEAGHEVTIVEMADAIAADLLFINAISLLRSLTDARVQVLTGHRVTEIDEKGLTAVGPEGEVHVDADTVVTAFGVRPAHRLADALAASGLNVHAIGDCVLPAKVGEAINAGYLTAAAL